MPTRSLCGPAGRRQAQAREPHPEERAAPFVQQRLDACRAPGGDSLGDLGSCVARSQQRGFELGVRRLAPGGGRGPTTCSEETWSEY